MVHKDRAARLWCENVTALTGKPWRYLKVPQKTFGQLEPTTLGDLVALSANGSMKGTLTLPGIFPANDPVPAPPSEFRAFLDEVYGLVAAGSERKALTRIFDFCDELVLAENFSSCSAVLKEVDLDRLEATTALGFLSITNPAKERLPDRAQYLDRVATKLSQTRTEDYVEGLLRGCDERAAARVAQVGEQAGMTAVPLRPWRSRPTTGSTWESSFSTMTAIPTSCTSRRTTVFSATTRSTVMRGCFLRSPRSYCPPSSRCARGSSSATRRASRTTSAMTRPASPPMVS
nr:hypothetical protein [Deltaproteobacteria bacterium]